MADGGDPDQVGTTADDAAILNLISQTAKKSSYNNSRRQGLEPDPGTQPPPAGRAPSGAPPKKQVPKKKKKGGGFLCGCGAALEAVDEGGPGGEARDDGVLRDPSSAVSYEMLHLVGEGGFSKVLLVRAKSGHLSGPNGKGVYAAKIIPKAHLKSAGESFIKATMLERNILGEFDHPFLLKLYHSFQEKDKLVLVVDYCPGGSLHTHVNISLREDGRGFGEARAAFYVAEIGLGIAHLHSHGIIHRDLKLENVLMHASGHCAVSDFGAPRAKPMPPRTAAGDQPPATTRPPGADAIAAGLAPNTTGPAPPLLATTKLWRIVKSKPRYDPDWAPETLDVLRSMLQKRPTTRLSSLKTLGHAKLYAPPLVPDLGDDDDRKYVPKRIAETAVPESKLDYKKGDSMQKLFRKFSHRTSFDDEGVKPPTSTQLQ
ncbi:serine/threonine kinase [Aureococcus anophagefferens]|nr:serine/threonine kinase [Aureococcus anophagefferens]